MDIVGFFLFGVLGALLTVYLTDRCDPKKDYKNAVLANEDIVVISPDGVNFTVNGDEYKVQ